jgi:hypothetical protein
MWKKESYSTFSIGSACQAGGRAQCRCR